MKFLFWNIKNINLKNEIAELILQENADLACFAEMDDAVLFDVLILLQKKVPNKYFHQVTPGCERVKVIIKRPAINVMLLNQSQFYSLLKFDTKPESLVVGLVHFPSKLFNTDDDIRRECEKLLFQVNHEENMYETTNTIIIGDFNANPFELPMISFSGINATNSKDYANNLSVTRNSDSRKLFYNPMWTLYSKYNDRPGTHKYIRTGTDIIAWHFLDQVLIRPSLINNFVMDALEIVTKVKSKGLVNKNGIPNISDHLPLVCELTI